MNGILQPEKVAEAERERGLTLKEASDIVKALQGDKSTEPFDPMEREAITFLAACWKCGYITQELFEELIGQSVPLPM